MRGKMRKKEENGGRKKPTRCYAEKRGNNEKKGGGKIQKIIYVWFYRLKERIVTSREVPGCEGLEIYFCILMKYEN